MHRVTTHFAKDRINLLNLFQDHPIRQLQHSNLHLQMVKQRKQDPAERTLMKKSPTPKRKLQLVRRRQLLMLKQQKPQLLGWIQLLVVVLLLQWGKNQLQRLLPFNYRNGRRIALLGN